MADWWDYVLGLFGLQRAAGHDFSVEVERKGDKSAVVKLPPYGSISAADRDLQIAKKRAEMFAANRRAAEDMVAGVKLAGELVKVSKETTIELAELDGKLEKRVADNELAKELRPEEDQITRLEVEERRAKAAAATHLARANERIAQLEANKLVADAAERFAIPAPPDPQVAAAERSRAEQDEELRDWAANIVGDVAAWTYPVEDGEGYLAYAAIQYFGPRLDQGKSHEDASAMAVTQLVNRRRLHGVFSPEQTTDMARRAKVMWRKFKQQVDEARVEAQRQKTADTVLDAARQQFQAAALIRDVINGRDSNGRVSDEKFDPTE